MKRIITIVIVMVLVASLVELGEVIVKPHDNLKITVAPSVAKITLDGKQRLSGGTTYVAPGGHQLVASLAGFSNDSSSFTIKSGRSTAINLVLNPSSQTGYSYLQSNPGQEQLREQLGGQKFDASINLQQQLFPIIKLLPYQGLGYAINYGQAPNAPNTPSKIALYVSFTNSEGQARAINWIKFNGYNPADYTIIDEGPGSD